MSFWRELRVEDDLGQAKAIPEIDEDETAEVTPPVHPTGQGDLLPGIRRPKGTAGHLAEGAGIDVDGRAHAWPYS